MPELILVTGASGFIGSNVARELVHRGHEVWAVGRTRVPEVPGARNLKIGDFRELPSGRETVCVHAANPAHFRGFDADAIRRLIDETHAMNRWIADSPFKRRVYCSSAAVYGDRNSAPRKESDEPAPIDSYGAMKLDGEKFFSSENDAIVRLSNVYGTGMSTENVLSRILSQLDSPRLAMRTLSPVRDYLEVTDVASAIADVALSEESGVFNIGSGRGLSVADLISEIDECIGLRHEVSETAPSNEPSTLILNIEKIKTRIGWEPALPVREGLFRIIKKWKNA